MTTLSLEYPATKSPPRRQFVTDTSSIGSNVFYGEPAPSGIAQEGVPEAALRYILRAVAPGLVGLGSLLAVEPDRGVSELLSRTSAWEKPREDARASGNFLSPAAAYHLVMGIGADAERRIQEEREMEARFQAELWQDEPL